MKILNNVSIDNTLTLEELNATRVALSSTPGIGEFSWNDTDGTANLTLKGGSVVLQLGQEFNSRVYNAESFSLVPGNVVYAYGAVNGQTSVKLANASSEATSRNTVGVITEVIPPFETGFATIMGKVRELDTSTFLPNDTLYLSTLDGQFTNIKPQSPNFVVAIGWVSEVGVSTGSIRLSIHVVPNADEISYDNASSGLVASNVQSAVDELNLRKADVSLLSSNIVLYATNVAADVGSYYKLVTNVDDPDYNDSPVNVNTGAITGTAQLISSLVASPSLFIGNPGYINISTIGNVRKVTGNSTQYAEFFFRVYKRTVGGVETLVSTSNTTGPVQDSAFMEFNATAVLNNGFFIDTDRIVVKYFANILSGTGPTYEFQFGGATPVRTLLPVPVSVIPSGDASSIIVSTSSFNGVLSGADNNIQSALNTIDDHNHDSRYYTESEVDAIFAAVPDSANEIAVVDAGGYYTGVNVETALQEVGTHMAQINTIMTDTNEPTGFLDRSAIMTFNQGTRTFTITGSIVYYFKGIKYSKVNDSYIIANTVGMHYLYYDNAGIIKDTSTFPGMAVALAAFIYWNGTQGNLADERHGLVMDAATHTYLHETEGTRYHSGLTATFTSTTFSVAQGAIRDEDNLHNIPTQTTCDVYYKNGSVNWVWNENQTKYYHDNGTNVYYNNVNALTTVANNSYVAYWIFATNSLTRPIISIMGQRVDGTITAARANNRYEDLVFGEIPFKEIKILFRVILQGNRTYQEAQDLRSIAVGGTGTYVATAHDVLTGILGGGTYHLSDIQYADLTDAGDTILHTHDSRYYTETEIDTMLSGLSTAADDITIVDTGAYFTATHVEGALQEIGLALDNISGSAVDISITDTGAYYDATNVEAALQEIAGDVGAVNTALGNYQLKSEKGQANGYASLGADGLIPNTQLPSFVDDVLEYATLPSFPVTGVTGKIYVALDTNKTYRWSGSTYVYITSGAVDSVAGKTGVVSLVKGDVGLGNVDNTADSTKSVASAATLTTPRTLTIGSTGKTFNGSANVAWSLVEIGAQASGAYAAEVHTHGTYDNSAALTGANVYSNVAITDGIVTGLTSRALTASDIGAAKQASNEAIATDGQVLTANGDGTFTFESPSSGSAVSIFTEEFTATEGQTNFTLITGSYSPNNDRLIIYIWGLRQHFTAFTETSGTTFALAAGVPAGTKIIAEWRTADPVLKGDAGVTPTITVGTVTTGSTGSSVSITNVGTPEEAIFDFVIPKGDIGNTGLAATITVGTVTTLAAGSSATITNVGSSESAIFDFGIPRGAAGSSSAEETTIADIGDYYTGINVETALQEIGVDFGTVEANKADKYYPIIIGSTVIESTDQYHSLKIKSTHASAVPLLQLRDGAETGFDLGYDKATAALSINKTIAGAYDSTLLALHSDFISYKGNTVWHAGNDGTGSGLDADTLDGIQAASLAPLASPTFTGTVTVATRIDFGAAASIIYNSTTKSFDFIINE